MAGGSSMSGPARSWGFRLIKNPPDRRHTNEHATDRPVYLFCAGHLHWLRGYLEGPNHPAYAADVRLQRDPWYYPGRSSPDRRLRADAGTDCARFDSHDSGYYECS